MRLSRSLASTRGGVTTLFSAPRAIASAPAKTTLEPVSPWSDPPLCHLICSLPRHGLDACVLGMWVVGQVTGEDKRNRYKIWPPLPAHLPFSREECGSPIVAHNRSCLASPLSPICSCFSEAAVCLPELRVRRCFCGTWRGFLSLLRPSHHFFGAARVTIFSEQVRSHHRKRSQKKRKYGCLNPEDAACMLKHKLSFVARKSNCSSSSPSHCPLRPLAMLPWSSKSEAQRGIPKGSWYAACP